MTNIACPACVVVPPEAIEPTSLANHSLQVTVPTAHCVGCISKIERGLQQIKGVKSARVNLSLKRVQIQHDNPPDIEEKVLNCLDNLGFAAHILDSKVLENTTDDVSKGLLIRLGVAGFAAMNVMLLSVSVWAGAEGTTRDFLHWISAAIALPTVAYTAQPFFKSAWSALRIRQLNMDVPISLAILMAAGLSLYETIHSGEHAYFDAALSLTFFLLAGRFLDYQTRAKARSAAVELTALEVSRAHRLKNGVVETVDVADLKLGDHVMVRSGERVPVDGTVSKGIGELDVSLLTGETMPQDIAEGDQVYSGTLNLGQALEISVSHIGQGTKLAEITALVATAEASKTKYTNLADKAARIYAPVIHLLALVAFVGWYIYSGDARLSVGIATAVLIITCPCALGLAVPAVMTAASGKLFRLGVLIRNGDALERLVDVDTVVFDKTGTLTTGQFKIVQVPSDQHLQLAASLAVYSDHPLSKAIVKQSNGTKLLKATNIRELPGKGIEGIVNGQKIKLGRADWLKVTPIKGYVQTWVQIDDETSKVFTFEDTLKNTAQDVIQKIKNRGLKVVMLSGDTQETTDRLAQKLGVEQAIGDVLPEEKLAIVQSFGDTVLMVGDGLNDTAALAAAHVSISPAAAIDAARAASDFVLIKDDLTLIDKCISLSGFSKRLMLQSFGVAAGYNAIALPIALLGFATPLLAALAMSASSICVSLNALRITRG